MIYFLPIEPVKERYSIQWLEWFKTAFDDMKVPHVIIDPPNLTDGLDNAGDVLNMYNTNYYKSAQLCELMKLFQAGEIKSGDSIVMMDGWNPVITQLEYVRKMSGIHFNIVGLLHAGTWDKNDFVNRYNFKDALIHKAEQQWLASMDLILVATDYHKKLITDAFPNSNLHLKIKKVLFPLKLPEHIYTEAKQNIVVFPHRLDGEKQDHLFTALRDMNTREDIRFLKTKEYSASKEEYYNILKRSKVAISFALQETFGIAMLESVFYGNLPIVPNDLAYAEMYPSYFMYDRALFNAERDSSLNILLRRIYYFIDNYDMFAHNLKAITSKYEFACEDIITEILTFNRYEFK